MPANLADRADFEDANRGLVARLEPGVVKSADGRVVYDADVFTQITAGDCADTVHPSLWRQSQLTAVQGLFEVTEGIYQLRGIELSTAIRRPSPPSPGSPTSPTPTSRSLPP